MRDFYNEQIKNFNANIEDMEQKIVQLELENKSKDDRIEYL